MAIAHAIWNYLFGWAGIDILIGFGFVALAVFVPIKRNWTIAAAVVAFTLAGAIAHGYRLGLDEKQREWDASLAREAHTGEQARDDAVRDIGPVTRDRSLFNDDPYNRDRGAK